MKNRKILNYFLLSLCLFLFSSLSLEAGSANLSFSGNSSVYNGNTIDITLSVSGVNAEGGITAIGGQINYDSNYLEYVSFQSLGPITVRYEPGTKRFAGLSFGGPAITGNTGVIKLTFRAKQLGNTTITFSGASVSDSASNAVTVNNPSKSISITNPPSSNNNLSSLSITGGAINFNKNTTSYTIKVGKDVTNVTINATPEDGGASVSGTGTKNLNYGNNSFTVTVKAANGSVKTYTVNVNREDPRSSNNNLSNIKINGASLNPSFKPGTTTYTVTVPFSIENLDIKATAEDKKASVSISGQNGLLAEATTDVLVKVTAENGSVKTYTIKVTREKDPNKPKSGNNYLSSLTTNIGILSPVFDKEKLNYVIYLPYEIDKITLTATVDDTQYGVLETEGPETLKVGSNKYTFKVTTEDGSSRTYTVNVIRGASLDQTSNNTLLKNIEITNGSLDKKFQNNINVYKYSRKKGFKINPIPEDENAVVTIIEHEQVYTIIIEDSNGGTNVYTLIPESETKENIAIIIAILVASIPVIGGGTFLGYKIGMRKMLNKIKSLKPKEHINETFEKQPFEPKEEIKQEKDKKIKKENKTKKPKKAN